MEQLLPQVFTSGWASGINPYLMVLLTGLLGRVTDNVVPEALARTDVLVVAGILTVVDFVADKIAYIDSTWDAINTFVRPTAGAVVAALIASDSTTLAQALYAATGGLTAFASHSVKSGFRLAVNTSPEPASNVVVSLVEDFTVTGVVVLAFAHPWLAASIALVLLVTGMSVVLLLWRTIRRRRAARRARRAEAEARRAASDARQPGETVPGDTTPPRQ